MVQEQTGAGITMFGKKPDEVSKREIGKRMRLDDQSSAAFSNGDLAKALELAAQAEAIRRREHAMYNKYHPLAPVDNWG